MTRKRGEPGVQAKSLAACSSLLALSSATGSRTEDATKNTAGRSRWTDWAGTKNEGWRFLSQDGPRPNANITDVPPKHTYWFLCLVTFSCRYYVVPIFFFILFSKIQHQQNHCWIIFTFKSLSGAAPPKYQALICFLNILSSIFCSSSAPYSLSCRWPDKSR